MKSLYERILPFFNDGSNRVPGQSIALCYAALHTRHDNAISEIEYQATRSAVKIALAGASTVHMWLENKGYLKDIKHLPDDERMRQIQTYRKRWLKHLCEEYENRV